MNSKFLSTLPAVKEIEIPVMTAWLASGAITETERGQENIYFKNEFGHQFFCKCL